MDAADSPSNIGGYFGIDQRSVSPQRISPRRIAPQRNHEAAPFPLDATTLKWYFDCGSAYKAAVFGGTEDSIPYNNLVQATPGGPISHTNMLGGKSGRLLVGSEHNRSRFLRCITNDIRQMVINHNGFLEPFSEIHSIVFPLYLDLDLCLPVRDYACDFVDTFVGILHSVLQKLYPDGHPSRIVVSTKHFGSGPVEDSSRSWTTSSAAHFVPLTFSELEEEKRNTKGEVERVLTHIAKNSLSNGRLVISEGDWLQYPCLSLWRANANTVLKVREDGLAVQIGTAGRGPLHPPPEGELYLVPETRRWKHGLHVHLPSLHVDIHTAKLIRLSLVEKMESRDWTDLLGVQAPCWNDVVDERVYCKSNNGGGLRIIGAPKVSRCRMKDCIHHDCSKKGVAVDPNFYWPKFCYEEAYGGDLVRNREEESRLALSKDRENILHALRMTTVRCDEGGAEVTRGFKPAADTPLSRPESIFDACPAVSGKKRRSDGGKAADSRRFVPVESASKLRALDTIVAAIKDNMDQFARSGSILGRLSGKYRTCTYIAKESVAKKAGQTYNVYFRGEGSRYCMNYNNMHRSQGAYMTISKTMKAMQGKNGRVSVLMRCTCRCSQTRETASMRCSDWSQSIFPAGMEVDPNLMRSLFP